MYAETTKPPIKPQTRNPKCNSKLNPTPFAAGHAYAGSCREDRLFLLRGRYVIRIRDQSLRFLGFRVQGLW